MYPTSHGNQNPTGVASYPAPSYPPNPHTSAPTNAGSNPPYPSSSAPSYPPPPPGSNLPDSSQGIPPPGGQKMKDASIDNAKLLSSNVEASAPELNAMDKVPGYETISFDTATAPPPAYSEIFDEHPNKTFMSAMPEVTEEQIRDCLLQFVSEKCCYGRDVAKELVFNNLDSSCAFHYNLDTFTEKRETTWAYEPFHGQHIDSTAFGRPPAPWEIQVILPEPFTKNKLKIEVPHTASVKPCHSCLGFGYRRCFHCHGRGCSECFHCHGHGTSELDRSTCMTCNGTGHKSCFNCNGYGRTVCGVCSSSGQLKCFIELTVTWTVHTDNHVVERTSLPDHLVTEVAGQVAFEEENIRVSPVTHFPDQAINVASSEFIERHSKNYQAEKILLQRHKIQIVPVVQAFYTWKGRMYNFCVYGFEQKVYAPDYPQRCCWCCNIL